MYTATRRKKGQAPALNADTSARWLEAGKWLKEQRERAGLTQNQIATHLGLTTQTMVSQIERGYLRLPPDRIMSWANLLKVDAQPFAKALMSFYDPVNFNILFTSSGDATAEEVAVVRTIPPAFVPRGAMLDGAAGAP